MSALVDRLRGVLRDGPAAFDAAHARKAGPYEDSVGPAEAGPHDETVGRAKAGLHDEKGHLARDDRIAETLDGEWHGEEGRRYLVVDRKYGPGHRHGRVAVADVLPPADGAWPHLDLLTGPSRRSLGDADSSRRSLGDADSSRRSLGDADSSRRSLGDADSSRRSLGDADSSRRSLGEGGLLFIDLETTGLAGGAGSYAFLVGCAWFDGAVFRIRQFFLSSFGGEVALLAAVSSLADGVAGVVTYNGKSFDLPLLETRFALNRMRSALLDLPHVDMLHPARRLWKETDSAMSRADAADVPGPGSCRLTALERSQCGFIREGDVPGFEIPARYFGFVRSGDARPLASVLEHNRLDLISLALLTGRACQLLDEGAAGAVRAREALGLGRIYEADGRLEAARACYARAAGVERGGLEAGPLPADAATRAEGLRAYAMTCRRARRHADAADAWTRLLNLRGCPPALVREAGEALAVHHEHRLRDPGAARAFALQSLRLQASGSREEALRYRLARLERKLAPDRPPDKGARLFAAQS